MTARPAARVTTRQVQGLYTWLDGHKSAHELQPCRHRTPTERCQRGQSVWMACLLWEMMDMSFELKSELRNSIRHLSSARKHPKILIWISIIAQIAQMQIGFKQLNISRVNIIFKKCSFWASYQWLVDVKVSLKIPYCRNKKKLLGSQKGSWHKQLAKLIKKAGLPAVGTCLRFVTKMLGATENGGSVVKPHKFLRSWRTLCSWEQA